MQPADLELVAGVLGDAALASIAGPEQYFRDLVTRAELPAAFRAQLAGFGGGDPRASAIRLVRWADTQGTNPGDKRYTTLGSILEVLLDDVGLEAATGLVAVIVSYGLYRDQGLLTRTTQRFQVPDGSLARGPANERTPDFVWRGPTEDVALQGLLRKPAERLDVGFLTRAIERSSGVCRIERSSGEALGTGFLVSSDLVLTNYHVLAMEPGADPNAMAGDAVLRFGCVTAGEGKEAEGQTFRLDDAGPVVRLSPVEELDFALLRAEAGIRGAADLRPIEFTGKGVLAKGMGLNILQHPAGGPMEMGFSSNGITDIYDDIHRVQYVTSAAGGSSGSPCFDDAWDLVALHHAERSKAFGAVREGIPMAAIHGEISGDV